ncbi:copper chaperone PCu(A)C [Actinacidiphila sp. DG2A-62]|uniref:copper chaperone PCu(A)C n=1 Tax=Actinacidiphila sp. DG2A-62 TaxID=3108821 RepID=UPI002DBF8516|nr:copper chaperone PCu(A)C [Actinacidiphila sp. DG2A-62]MEC3993874.1 copper chaperone PCu(A)C [Actinacidiphila sp. DG2A-62]
MRPAGRRIARGAAVPVAAGAAGLLALSLYASTGAAGAPAARIEVTGGRLLLPSNPEATAAFFDLRNTGGSADTLLGVDSPELGPAMLTRTAVAAGAGHMERVAGVLLRPGARLSMTPYGTDVMIPHPRGLALGAHVAFDLRFAGSGTIRVRAVVVRPGG